jgi:hypothetical protein
MERMNRRETLSGATEIAAAATLPAQIAQARNFARHDRKQIPSQKHLKFQLLRATTSSFCVGYPRMALIPPRWRSV